MQRLTPRRAVFLDRDGVINEEVDYLSRCEQLRVLPGAPMAIRRLRGAGFKVIVVTNQSGVGRGYFSLNRLRQIHALLRRRLAERGAGLDALYFCPHLPGDACACRKPALGMLERARKRFSLDFKASYFVGDSTTDVKTARAAGCGAVLVRTGKGGRDGRFGVEPDRVCRDLAAAADWILRRGDR
jgi:D-glycero-D-manno-heptose 1,7-bisphosphate phosphatase